MTNQLSDPYAVLGVPPTASASQVREAYRRLAKQFHPDRSSNARATDRMRRLNQAWETLSSPAARARYDATTAVPPATASPHWGGSRRSSRPRYAEPPRWAASRAATTADAWQGDDAGPLRWGLVLLAVPALVLLTALFGGIVPIPILGLLLFFLARVALRGGD